MSGYNSCIFAYGQARSTACASCAVHALQLSVIQLSVIAPECIVCASLICPGDAQTGSGKTFTMLGPGSEAPYAPPSEAAEVDTLPDEHKQT